MGLLKFLFIAILVLWLVRIVARMLFPWAMRKMAQKVMGDAVKQQQYHSRGRHEQTRQDGSIRIDYVPPKTKAKNGAKSAGEFVDFEEIKSSTK